jgi:hypothetical protein
MLKRRLPQVLIALGLVVVSILGMTSAASAAPSSFTAASIHGNGAGSVGAEGVGGITWYNRSVTLTSVRFYVAANECGSIYIAGYQGITRVANWDKTQCVAGWVSYGDVSLDGSGVSGGITEVLVMVDDDTHRGSGFADCFRSASSCTRD